VWLILMNKEELMSYRVGLYIARVNMFTILIRLCLVMYKWRFIGVTCSMFDVSNEMDEQ